MKTRALIQNCQICKEPVLKYLDGEGEVMAVCSNRHESIFGRYTYKEVAEGLRGRDWVSKIGIFAHYCKGCGQEIAKSDGKVKFHMECRHCGEHTVFEKGIKLAVREGKGHYNSRFKKTRELVNPTNIK